MVEIGPENDQCDFRDLSMKYSIYICNHFTLECCIIIWPTYWRKLLFPTVFKLAKLSCNLLWLRDISNKNVSMIAVYIDQLLVLTDSISLMLKRIKIDFSGRSRVNKAINTMALSLCVTSLLLVLFEKSLSLSLSSRAE